MKVRAKFTCVRKEPQGEGAGVEVVFTAFADEEGSNSGWSKYTPSAELRMHITNPPAEDFFEAGKSYFLDFSSADD